MAKRRSLSQKIRFEVFKRDKFKCTYCGLGPTLDNNDIILQIKEISTDVVLEVDHSLAVANGGDNDMLNLRTSCKKCNLGKSATPLDDHSVLAGQITQMQILEEKKQQIQMMFEWRQSLVNLDEEVYKQIFSYLQAKVKRVGKSFAEDNPYWSVIYNWIKKYSIEDILNAIDSSEKRHLVYSSDSDELDKNIGKFLDSIPNSIRSKNNSELDSRIGYTGGIARNRFNYWDNKKGYSILNDFRRKISTLLCEEDVLEVVNNQLIPMTKTVANWSEWKITVEKLAEDILLKAELQANNSMSSIE